MPNDPYYFPFEKVNKDELIPGDKYYIKLNDNIIKTKFLDLRRNLPVSHLEGVFERLHTEPDRITTPVTYAVFKKVRILNKIYKEGLCNLMLVRYPEGFLASAGGCSSYSDFSGRTVNEDREVFFNVNRWMFGKPTEYNLLKNKVINKVSNQIGEDNILTTKELLGEKIEKPEKKEIGGRKKRIKKNKTKIYKRNKSNKSRTRRRR